MHKLILIRHGQSTWNLDNRFTGWVDVDLSERGVTEAREAGRTLREAGFGFDLAVTSLLKRSIRTLWLVLEELDLMWLPELKDWRLNERHYGALQGLDKRETVERHGEEQVMLWRRSYDTRPPALDTDDPRHPRFDPRYAALENPPSCESLEDTLARVVPYWEDTLMPAIRGGRRVLVVAHGNSLRALVKHLDGISDEEIPGLNIPTGIPLVYELDAECRALSHRYLADEEQLAAAVGEVASQTARR